jgi:CDP-diacylglycerol---glycerol-3-phosphate 3-phosphatidyltransferase
VTITAPFSALAGYASPANLVTFGRILASPFLFWLILEAEPDKGTSWAAFVLGWLFGYSDYYDGVLARRRGTFSRLGAFLDPLADKIVVLGCSFSLVAVGRFHWLPVLMIAMRELWISLYRASWARHGVAIPARKSAKWKTFIQGLVLVFAVFPPLLDAQVAVDIALWAVVAFTVYTGWQYLRDGSASAHAVTA